MGEVMVWELGSRERIASKNFKVWDLGSWSVALQVWLLILFFSFCTCHVWCLVNKPLLR